MSKLKIGSNTLTFDPTRPSQNCWPVDPVPPRHLATVGRCIMLDGDPAPSPKGAHPQFSSHVYLWPNGRASLLLLSTCFRRRRASLWIDEWRCCVTTAPVTSDSPRHHHLHILPLQHASSLWCRLNNRRHQNLCRFSLTLFKVVYSPYV